MNATLPKALVDLAQYRTVDALIAAAKVEAVPHPTYQTGYTYRVAMPAGQFLADGRLPREGLRGRFSSKREAVEAGRSALYLALANAEVRIPGTGHDDATVVSLSRLMADS